MNCSTNCNTGPHRTFGECLRAKNISPQWLGGVQPSAGDQKRFARENDRYRQAVRQGLEPAGVSNRAVDQAYRAAEV